MLGLTVAQAAVLAEGHAAADAAEARARMLCIRTAVWAEAEEFARATEPPAGRDGDDRAAWLEGYAGEGTEGTGP